MLRQVNLLPEEIQKSEQLRFLRFSLTVIFLPVFVVLFLISSLLNGCIQNLEETARQPLAFQETTATRDLKKKIEQQENVLGDFAQENTGIIETYVKNSPTAYFLKVISRLSAQKVWLTGIALDTQGRTCKIKGKSFTTRLVSEFMLELKRLPHFQEVELVSVGKEGVKPGAEVDFQIICHLK